MKVFLVLLLLFTIGCEKDPLKGKSENVRQGIPAPTRTKIERKPCPKDTIILEQDPLVGQFIEGNPGQMLFKARAVNCKSEEFRIEILRAPSGVELLESNEGNASVLKWTPSISSVQDDKDYFTDQFKIRVFSIADTTSHEDFSVRYIISKKQAVKPEILDNAKELLEGELQEGRKLEINITVRDPDADKGRVDRIVEPKLNVVPLKFDDINGTRFVAYDSFDFPQQDLDDPELWHFKLIVDTNRQDPVSEDTYLRFGVYAVSRHGIMSDVKEVIYKVINRVGSPKVTWPEDKLGETTVVFQKGAHNTFTFWAYDPKGEGDVSAKINKNCGILAGMPTCKCEFASMSRRIYKDGSICTISWNVPKEFPDDSLRFNIEAKNTNFEDKTNFKTTSVRRKIKFVEPVAAVGGEL